MHVQIQSLRSAQAGAEHAVWSKQLWLRSCAAGILFALGQGLLGTSWFRNPFEEEEGFCKLR